MFNFERSLKDLVSFHDIILYINEFERLEPFSIFIDDSISNFIECNNNGVFTLLKDTEHNRGFETHLRIYSLTLNEIMDKFNKYGK